MTEHYCTLFDSTYLSRGVAMLKSLFEHNPQSFVYVFAFDDKCLSTMKTLNMDRVTVISLSEFEDDELLKIKGTRSKGEYCWTCTPSTVLYCLKKFNLKRCTYVDSDLFFYGSTKYLFEDMGEDSVYITPHNHSPKYVREQASGIYCVQFVSFVNDEKGLKALEWWRERCNEWCYAYYEDGKIGDQKYLDDWTVRFEGVKSAKYDGGMLAPWNIQQYKVKVEVKGIEAYNKKQKKSYHLVFYHFHQLKFFTDGRIDIGWYDIPKDALNILYKTYVEALEKAKNYIDSKKIESFDAHGSVSPPNIFAVRYLLGINIYKKDHFL